MANARSAHTITAAAIAMEIPRLGFTLSLLTIPIEHVSEKGGGRSRENKSSHEVRPAVQLRSSADCSIDARQLRQPSLLPIITDEPDFRSGAAEGGGDRAEEAFVGVDAGDDEVG